MICALKELEVFNSKALSDLLSNKMRISKGNLDEEKRPQKQKNS